MDESQKTIFLTGGAGYIGKCLAIRLIEAGFSPILLDDFSTSARLTSEQFTWKDVNLADSAALKRAWGELPHPLAVIHLAARALVGESVSHPELYFRNNLNAALNVADLAAQTPGCVIVHSSSCAVYGLPNELPIRESSPKNPVSPYGMSKWMVEEMLNQFREWRKLPTIHLRYFNPAGAIQYRDQWYGEAHEPETHLIPLIIKNAFQSGKIPVFGTDYPTPDGTCIRDYIHIQDLCDAHLMALEYLWKHPKQTESFNLGIGKGTSVKEVVTAASKVLGKSLQVEPLPRRQGDPPALFAKTDLAQTRLGWKPKHTLEEMIQSHFYWMQSRLNSMKEPNSK